MWAVTVVALTGQRVVIEVQNAEQGHVGGPGDGQVAGEVAALQHQHLELVQAVGVGAPGLRQAAVQAPVPVQVQRAQRRERPIIRPAARQRALHPQREGE